MSYRNIHIQGTSSTFAAQVGREVFGLGNAPLGTICDVIGTLAAANTHRHGAVNPASGPAAMEWNAWAQQNGCSLPYASTGVKNHPDVAVVDAAVKAAIAQQGTGQVGTVGPVTQPGTAPSPAPSVPGSPQVVSATTDPTGQVGLGGQTQAQGPEEAEWWKNWLNGILSFFRALGFGGPEEWAVGKSAELISLTDRLAAAKKTNSNIDCIGVVSPVALSGMRRGASAAGLLVSSVPEWAYSTNNGTSWHLPLNRVPDPPFPSIGVTAPRVGSCSGIGDDDDSGEGGHNMGLGGEGIGELLGSGVEPRVIEVRRCGRGMRLAVNGRCYRARLLPRAWWANKKRDAPVSWRDAEYIKKGERAAKAIRKHAENRGLLRETHTHRHEHRRKHD